MSREPLMHSCSSRYPVDSIAEGLMKKFEVTEVDSKTFVVKALRDMQEPRCCASSTVVPSLNVRIAPSSLE